MDEQSVDILCKQIIDEAKKEAESTLTKARTLAEQRVKLTEQQANNEAKKILDAAREESEHVRKKILSSLNLEEHKRLLQKQESFIQSIIAQVHDELASFAKSSAYETFLKQSIVEAVRQLNVDKPVTLTFGSRDPRNLCTSAAKEAEKVLSTGKNNVSLTVDTQTHDQNGVIVSSDNGLIRINNTLQERLRDRIDQVRAYIHEQLFEKGASNRD